MSTEKAARVIGTACILACLALPGWSGDQSAAPAQAASVDWQKIPADQVPQAEADADLEVCQRLCNLANTGNRQWCLDLLGPPEW